MELQGRVVKILALQEGVSQSTGNQWRRQDFLFGFYESGESLFEKRIKMDVMNDKITELNLREGDQIKVRVGLTCREYPQGSGKYFNDIRTGDITIIRRAGENKPADAPVDAQTNNRPQPQQQAATGGENDDLPF
jgi:hypothetical protein